MKYIIIILVLILCAFAIKAQTPNNGGNYSIIPSQSGNSSDLAELINEAIGAGYDDIYIPAAKNWVWNSTVTIPVLRRVNIWGSMPKSYDYAIKIRCGNKNPAIDAQGSLFTTVKGLNFLGDGKDPSKEPACLIVYARMPDRSSSSNHVLADNIIDGSFYYCCIYNIGAEECNYLNNYVSFSATHNSAISAKNAVYIYSENDVFPEIKSKRPRPKGGSMSAITNSNEIIKSFVKGSSNFYLGVHSQDISLNINYASTAENSNFLTVESIAGNIHISPNRVELSKSSHLIKILGNNNVGPINIEKGSFIRSDIANAKNEVYAIDVEGSLASNVILNISPFCNFFTTAFKPDIKLLKIDRNLTSSDINFSSSAEGAEVVINKMLDSKLLMKSENKLSGTANNPGGGSTYPKVVGSVTLPKNKTSVEISYKGNKLNRGIATSTGNHYCYIKFSEKSFTIFVNRADVIDQSISYEVWSE